MYRKINIYINGEYSFSACKYKNCKTAIAEIRATKYIEIASIPIRYVTIYDYDKIKARYAK